jgi:predicted RNA-binding protein YlqC (UPF0109 family)
MRTRDQIIVRGYRAGASFQEIAETVGVHPSTVGKVLGRLGERPQPPRPRRDSRGKSARPTTGAETNHCTDTSHDETIRHMRNAGLSFERIGKHIGRSGKFAQSRAVVIGLHTPDPTINQPKEFVIDAELDRAHVRACLAQGGFVYREIRQGRVVEVRP